MIKEINIGKIVRPFGVKGEVKVQLYTDIPNERFTIGKTIKAFNDKRTQALVIQGFKVHQNHGILKCSGFESIDDARTLVNSILSIEIDTSKEDRIAFFDLMDCDVVEDQNHIGKVIEVMDNPAHPILRVLTPNQKHVLIPYVDAFVVDVDIQEKVINIQSIEGLL
ncbi:MAG: 16S rRNA processing protein RimM [Erysipelothrix sp.]|jgi:16S rRNA processing protein RimM|nr:16S rRNA processing protein RimM [Erysipelothrix sp.]